MAILTLVEDNEGNLVLHSDDPSRNAPFSIYDLDGGGAGDPFRYGNNSWTEIQGVEGIEYDADDTDSFWDAQQAIIQACIKQGIELPEYVEIWSNEEEEPVYIFE